MLKTDPGKVIVDEIRSIFNQYDEDDINKTKAIELISLLIVRILENRPDEFD